MNKLSKSNFFNGVCWRKPAKASASLAKSSLFKRGSNINIIIGFSCSRAAVALALGSSEGSVHQKSFSKMIYEHTQWHSFPGSCWDKNRRHLYCLIF